MHVIIVGAGPCGLSLSLALARVGIEVTLVDREKTIDTRPRAVHLTAPGIKIFRRAGVFEEVRRAGFLPKDWTYRKFDGTPIVTVEDIAVSKSPEATIVLPIGMLGEILLSHAVKNSKISLKWGHQVLDVGQDGGSAWATVRDQDGVQKEIRGDFLCGCDGGTSRVRKSLLGDRNFPGKTWDAQFVATDVYYPFDKFGFDDVNAIVHPQEGHLVARLTKDGLWRVAYQENINMSFEEVVKNQPAQYERLLPGHPKPEDYRVTNISPYKLHQRCAEKFRVGRICLAGDAAHLCNPWGGLGLTGGFADIIGLADCLQGIATGQADEDILDKYDEVRRSIFQTVIDPMSTANFLRISSLGTDAAIETDPFVAMCVAAKNDPKVKEKMEKSVYATCHDFTQYYKATAVQSSYVNTWTSYRGLIDLVTWKSTGERAQKSSEYPWLSGLTFWSVGLLTGLLLRRLHDFLEDFGSRYRGDVGSGLPRKGTGAWCLNAHWVDPFHREAEFRY